MSSLCCGEKFGMNVTALFVVPVVWSSSFLTQFFNFYLTEGLTAGLVLCSIGAFGIAISSIKNHDSIDPKWLTISGLLCGLSFLMKPAFVFLPCVLVFVCCSRSMFSWKKILLSVSLMVSFVVSSFAFAVYIHGSYQSKLGAVLTPLTFHLPLEVDCSTDRSKVVCDINKSTEKFTNEYNALTTPKEKFLFQSLNNGLIFWQAFVAAGGKDKANYTYEEMKFDDLKVRYDILRNVAVQKNSSEPGFLYSNGISQFILFNLLLGRLVQRGSPL